MKRIAILGLGTMGSGMAKNFQNAGYRVTVYNRNPKRHQDFPVENVHIASSPKEAAEHADIVIGMVRDNEASQNVWLSKETGALYGMKPNMIAIESSTLTPEWVKELGKSFDAKKIKFLEAPVVGSKPHVANKKLTYLIGGNKEVVESIRTVLSVNSTTIHYIGPLGTASVIKLAVNGLFGIQVAAFAEIVEMVKRSAIAIEQALEVLNTMPTASPILKVLSNAIVAKNSETNFPIHLVAKDFQYLVETASSLKTPSPTAIAVQNIYARAKQTGFGDTDISGIGKLFDTKDKTRKTVL